MTLLSLWNLMQRLQIDVICAFVRDIRDFEIQALTLHQNKPSPMTDDDANVLQPILALADAADAFFWLPATRNRRRRIGDVIEARCTYDRLEIELRVLRETLEDELRETLIIHMPAGKAVYYFSDASLLGEDVAAKFPDLVADIDEAGKCLAFGRATASVFHLMRVMETGVQELGKKLGVQFVDQKVWQNILDEVNKAIGALLRTDPDRAKLAELASLLFAVKLAWRNEVMHPKATYTDAEATAILHATKSFMGLLASLA